MLTDSSMKNGRLSLPMLALVSLAFAWGCGGVGGDESLDACEHKRGPHVGG